MTSYGMKHCIIIKPSSHLIGPRPAGKTNHHVVGSGSDKENKGELDEDYQNFKNDAGFGYGGISDPIARDARLQSTTRMESSEPTLRRDSVKAQERVFNFNSSTTGEDNIAQEENIKQHQRLGSKSGWIGKMTPIMNKGLMKAVILCGNEDDFLERNDKDRNILLRGDLDEDYNNFVNDADLEDGGSSDPKARDAKLEQPRKFSLSGPGMRYTSVNPYI